MTTQDLATPRQSVTSIVQAMAILRHLGENGRPLGVTAIAKAVNISPSSCFNILRTLVAEGMIEFQPGDKSYVLGSGVVELAHRALAQSKILSFLRHKLELLADEFQMTVALRRVTLDQRLVVIATAECSASTHIHVGIGHRVPLLAGAGGRCLAAFGNLTVEDMKERFERLRWYSRPPFEVYLEELNQVRQDGWAIDQNQLMAGVTSIAAPVFNEHNQVSHCITGTMFTGQHSPVTLNRAGEAVRHTAERVSRGRFPVSKPEPQK
jgi:DNA-binding IclR family transcriptional regulator